MPQRGMVWQKDKMGYIYRSWMKNQGFPEDLFDGRPVIEVTDEELAERKKEWTAPDYAMERGYVNLYVKHVNRLIKVPTLIFLVAIPARR